MVSPAGTADRTFSSSAPLRSGAARVRAHAVEPLERVLGGDLGVLGGQRIVDVRPDGELVPETLEVGERKGFGVAPGTSRPPVAQALLPEVERV